MTPQSDDCFALRPMNPKKEFFGVTQGNPPNQLDGVLIMRYVIISSKGGFRTAKNNNQRKIKINITNKLFLGDKLGMITAIIKRNKNGAVRNASELCNNSLNCFVVHRDKLGNDVHEIITRIMTPPKRGLRSSSH
ncbi:MAG: hypothetical protein NT038_04770 [Euryarchaeota archaeon]|nr:hypothetical protein [Euryarchaeota archaeon]